MTTNFNLPKLLAGYELNKHLPKAPYWWSESSLKPTGEAGKMIEAITGSVGNWLAGIKDARAGMFISSANLADLDRWGQDLQLPRIVTETDDQYRQRLLKEIVRQRATKPAIESFVTDVTGFECTVFQPWQFLHRPSVRNPNLAFGVPDPVNGRSGQTHRSSKYWTAGVIDIQTDDYSPIVRLETPELIAASILAYYTDRIAIGTIPPDDGITPSDLEWKIIYEILIPAIEGKQIYSGGVRSVPRSGRILIRDEYTLYSDRYYVSYQQLYDRPEFNGPCTVYDNPQTWDSLTNYTWDQALIGHNGEPTFEVLNKTNRVDLDFVVSLDSLMDFPGLTGTGSVYDTAQTWDSIGEYTWDEAIFPGYTSQPDFTWEASGTTVQIGPITTHTLLWDYSDVSPFSFYDSALSFSSVEDQTWEDALIATSGEPPFTIESIFGPLTFTPLSNGSFETIGASNIPVDWSITSSTPDAVNAFRDIQDTTENAGATAFVTEGNRAAEFYVLCNATAPSDNVYQMSQSILTTGNSYLAFDLTTGTHAQSASYGTLGTDSFGFVQVLIDGSVIWSTSAPGTTFRDVIIDLSGYQDSMSHTLSFKVGVASNPVARTYAHAFFDNVRFGSP